MRLEHDVVDITLTHARVNGSRGHTVVLQTRNLVGHQRYKGRDHQCAGRQDESWNLEAERLTPTGRHHAEDVASMEYGIDDVTLAGSEVIVPKGTAQYRSRTVQPSGHGSP
jgi:hypothetical protein